jgi:hypothetical protein
LSDEEYKSYKRIHDYEYPSDVEESKIKKEKKNHAKHRKKSKRLTEDLLRNITKLSDYDEAIAEEIEKESEKAKKAKGNATTHKKRYKKLEKYDDF